MEVVSFNRSVCHLVDMLCKWITECRCRLIYHCLLLHVFLFQATGHALSTRVQPGPCPWSLRVRSMMWTCKPTTKMPSSPALSANATTSPRMNSAWSPMMGLRRCSPMTPMLWAIPTPSKSHTSEFFSVLYLVKVSDGWEFPWYLDEAKNMCSAQPLISSSPTCVIQLVNGIIILLWYFNTVVFLW